LLDGQQVYDTDQELVEPNPVVPILGADNTQVTVVTLGEREVLYTDQGTVDELNNTPDLFNSPEPTPPATSEGGNNDDSDKDNTNNPVFRVAVTLGPNNTTTVRVREPSRDQSQEEPTLTENTEMTDSATDNVEKNTETTAMSRLHYLANLDSVPYLPSLTLSDIEEMTRDRILPTTTVMGLEGTVTPATPTPSQSSGPASLEDQTEIIEGRRHVRKRKLNVSDEDIMPVPKKRKASFEMETLICGMKNLNINA
jgi:hypothetical protein